MVLFVASSWAHPRGLAKELPASTVYAAPFTYEHFSDARKSATLATSSGVPRRPIGSFDTGKPFRKKEVSMGPGHTQFILMPRAAYRTAIALVNMTTAAFDAL